MVFYPQYFKQIFVWTKVKEQQNLNRLGAVYKAILKDMAT